VNQLTMRDARNLVQNYTTTLRSLSLPLVVVNGGFYLSPEEAKTVLVQCCNKMEMEQVITVLVSCCKH